MCHVFLVRSQLIFLPWLGRFDGGDVAFIILAGALVFLMVPGLGTSSLSFFFSFLFPVNHICGIQPSFTLVSLDGSRHFH